MFPARLLPGDSMEDEPFASFAVWAVRLVVLATAVALLWWSGQLEREFQAGNAAEFSIDWGLYWLIQAVYVVAGMAFAVAVRFPFPRARFAWGRLLIAGIVILPVVHLWFAFAVTSGPQFYTGATGGLRSRGQSGRSWRVWRSGRGSARVGAPSSLTFEGHNGTFWHARVLSPNRC
jgi:hypothetical protein